MDTAPNVHPLHLSQKVFWFVVSFCLLAVTTSYVVAIIKGRAVSAELVGLKLTLDRAENSIAESQNRLVEIRNDLKSAIVEQNWKNVSESADAFDSVLLHIGVAKSALREQQGRIQSLGKSTSGGFWTATPIYELSPTYDSYAPSDSYSASDKHNQQSEKDRGKAAPTPPKGSIGHGN